MRKSSYWDYHIRQYETPYRSTVSAINFLKKHLSSNEAITVLDIGCGGGANLYWMRQEMPKWQFTGIDIDQESLDIAKEKNPSLQFICADILANPSIIPDNSFDYAFAIQVVSFIPSDVTVFLRQALRVAKKGVFLTSLFVEDSIEQYTKAIDLKENVELIYKIYSLERLRSFINEYGQYDLDYEPFNIDIDLQKPQPFKFGTYTIKTEKGDRIQLSGCMLMPWYNVIIKKHSAE